MLQRSSELFQKVQNRIDMEPPSTDLSFLQLIVLSSQASIYRDLSMHEKAQERVDSLSKALFSLPGLDYGSSEWTMFFITTQLLSKARVWDLPAPAA
jgi:NO-binding membrane sensor protein with MHYT domain